ncbi:MAG: hypothetical protein ACJ72G_06910 [Friedmanniella sp.]|jgi:hypothetical protein
MTGETSDEAASRHQLFDAARHDAGWTVQQLWLQYMALGGTLAVFDLEAYLAGLMPLPAAEQDVLACALNERLADLNEPVRLPYLTALTEWPGEQALDLQLRRTADPTAD